MILLSHPQADDSARHVALALDRAGVLGEFWTCSAGSLAPKSFPLNADSLSNFAPLAVARAAPPRRPRSHFAACESLDRVVSTRVSSPPFRGVYAQEQGAEATFRSAGQHGLLRIYECNTPHWRAERDFCAEEAELEPEWADTLTWRAAPRAFARGDTELELADLVIVPSTFILHSLDRLATLPAAIAVVSPGAPRPPATSPPPSADRARGSDARKLRALFIGALGQRQGLSYLFRACREVRGIAELTVIGSPPDLPCAALARELRDVRWLPACSSPELRHELAAHDVLLSPSLFDGFNPILLDAMAAGLPIIATPQTAAPDFVDDGREGFLVPSRSSDAIVARLESLHREPDRRRTMSDCARDRAQRHDWERYERALAASVAAALKHR